MAARDEPLRVELSTFVAAPPEAVWARVSTFAGVNHELGPWLRMTSPDGGAIDPASVPIGERWFRSRLLLLGVLPVDYDDLTFLSVTPEAGFHERSAMLSMRVWEHERTLVAEGDGTRVTDRLSFVPRLRAATGAQRAAVAWTFRRRQRRLAAYFSDV
jgi:ligand-binding SRPBCC domain-containing protein